MPDQVRVSHDGSPLHPNGPPAGSLGAMIGQFKSLATERICVIPGMERRPIWQRSYNEHIIRNEQEFQRIWNDIAANPQRWQDDQLHPAAPPNSLNQG